MIKWSILICVVAATLHSAAVFSAPRWADTNDIDQEFGKVKEEESVKNQSVEKSSDHEFLAYIRSFGTIFEDEDVAEDVDADEVDEQFIESVNGVRNAASALFKENILDSVGRSKYPRVEELMSDLEEQQWKSNKEFADYWKNKARAIEELYTGERKEEKLFDSVEHNVNCV